MSRRHPVSVKFKPSFPRVSGDEPYGETYDMVDMLFSPRERG